MNAAPQSQQAEANHSLTRDGFEIVNHILPPEECDALADDIGVLVERHRTLNKSKLGGLRNLIRLMPQVAELASSLRFKLPLKNRLGRDFFPVRAIFFDKTPEANWSVAWHQDLSIAVAEKIETPGFTAWSVKEGTTHVQPSREILEHMVTVRLHLDDCGADHGALKVMPRSHLQGKLDVETIAAWTRDNPAFVCGVPKGGAVMMHPLLLHSSSPANAPSHRRVLHIEYASGGLPNGLKWFDC